MSRLSGLNRGRVVWASLPSPRGSEPGYRRPVLVVSSDAFNTSKIRTVTVAVVTSNLALALAPGNVALPRKSSGLPRDSVVNVSQTITLDREFLGETLAMLPAATMIEVDRGLALALDLRVDPGRSLPVETHDSQEPER